MSACRVGLRGAPLWACVLLVMGCEEPGTPVEDPEAAASPVAQGAGWDLSAVDARLREQGLHPVRRSDSVRQPFMSVPGTLVDLGTDELQIYVYRDHAARAHDTDRLDVHRAAPPHMMISWVKPPTLIVSDNLAAILLTHDTGLRQHVRQALAHPPRR